MPPNQHHRPRNALLTRPALNRAINRSAPHKSDAHNAAHNPHATRRADPPRAMTTPLMPAARAPYNQPPGPRPAPRALIRRHRSEEHTSELQSRGHLVCRLLLEKKKEEEAS